MKRKRITERGHGSGNGSRVSNLTTICLNFFQAVVFKVVSKRCSKCIPSVLYRGNFKPPQDHRRCSWLDSFPYLPCLPPQSYLFHATTHRSPLTRRSFHVNPQGIRTCCFWCSVPRWPARRHKHSASPTQPNHYSVSSIDVSCDDWSCGRRPAKAWASQTGRYRFSTLLIALDMSDTTSDSSQSLWPRSRSIQTDSISRAILVMSRSESRDVRYGRDCRSLSFVGTFLCDAANFAWPVPRMSAKRSDGGMGTRVQERGEEGERVVWYYR